MRARCRSVYTTICCVFGRCRMPCGACASAFAARPSETRHACSTCSEDHGASSKAQAVQKRYGLAARRANTLHAAVTSFSPSDSFQTAPFGLPKNVAVCQHLSSLSINPKHRHGTLAILSLGRDSRPFSLPFICPQ